MGITRDLLRSVNNRHSVRMRKDISLLVFPLGGVFFFLYKESASHQFLSRVGPCTVRPSKAGTSPLEATGS